MVIFCHQLTAQFIYEPRPLVYETPAVVPVYEPVVRTPVVYEQPTIVPAAPVVPTAAVVRSELTD